MARITHGTLAGPAGQLEFILNEAEPPEGRLPAAAAVVCHPHPLYGGTMNTRIVFHTARALQEQGVPVLRFNFRGVGRSAGAYDHGEGEQQDLLAAMAHMRSLYPGRMLLAGFSFGATVVAKRLARDALGEIAAAVLLGLPLDSYRHQGTIPSDWQWQGPKVMISGDHDEFAAVESLEAYFAALTAPKARRWIAGGDHFLAGHMDHYRATLIEELAGIIE